MERNERAGLIYGVMGVVIFGLTLPAMRVAVVELDSWFVSLGRAVIAALAGALCLWVARERIPPRETWGRLAITSAGVVIGFPVFATLAMQYAPAAHGGILLSILPLATAVAGVVFAGDRPSAGFWACSVAGTLAVLTFALVKGASEATLHVADLLLAGAVISAAIGYAAGGALSRELGGWQTICWVLLPAAPVCVAVLLMMGTPINWQASLPAWGSFFYLALMSQFVGFFAWYKGLALGGVAKVGQVQLLQPFVTLGASALLLGEVIGLMEIGFAVLVVGIVALARGMHVGQSRP